MKTITKFIYAAVAAVVVAIGSATANGALNDLFVSSNGNGDNGGGFIYQYTSTGVQAPLLRVFPGLAASPLAAQGICL